ncbi:MAG: thioredoxin domain-containing protein [Candidatus Binatia bacterium]|nr:thioredoxin domain-containing protein [Candidatus Binatia bacterium]
MSDARRTSSSSSATPATGALPALALVLSIVGMILGSVVLYIHQQLAASQGDYTSFCDISEGMSCDMVLGSSYANFLGAPVGAWALLAYLGTAAVSVYVMRSPAKDRLPAATALLALTGSILAVSLYFFAVSTFAIGVFCPMCLSLDVVSLALFGGALALFRILATGDRSGFAAGRFLGIAAAGTAVGIALLAVAQGGGSSSGPVTVEGIKRDDPRFYAYYISQPVVDPPIDERHASVAPVPITIVEFSDYQCPYCRRAFLDLSSVIAEGPGDVRVIHRNFPLNADCNPAIESRNHVVACQVAVASECASRQGKDAAFSYLAFTNQDDLATADLSSFAQQAGLDMAAYDKCVASPDAMASVKKDVRDGLDAGVESTPTLFINGRRIKGGFSRPEQYRYALAIERERLAAQAAQAATP